MGRKKTKNSIDNKSCGDVTFDITADNKKKLDMLANYTKQVDNILEEKPNFDGLINYVLSRGCDVVLKEVAKSHGVKVSSLYEMLSTIVEKDDVMKQMQYFSKMNIVSFANEIIREQPYFDGQMEMFGEEK